MTDGGAAQEKRGIRWQPSYLFRTPPPALHAPRQRLGICLEQDCEVVRTKDPGMPKLSSPSLDHPVLTPSSMPLTMPPSRRPSQLALDPLTQCPQELSRPWRMAGQQSRTQSPSRGSPPGPEAKPGHCQPWVCLSAEDGTTGPPRCCLGDSSETSQRSHSHEPSGPEERPFLQPGQRTKSKGWRKLKAGRGMEQTKMQEVSRGDAGKGEERMEEE